jgi:predicted RNase H-like HicB family nuclease
MKIQRPKNTKERGIMEFLVYKKGKTFIGVCLTFDIVEEGKNPTELLKSIKEVAELHLEVVIRENLPDTLLNRYAPEEYWKKYFETAKEIKQSISKSTTSLIRSPYYRSITGQIV